MDVAEKASPTFNTQSLAQTFMSEAASGRRYLIGKNEAALAIADTLKIEGIVDDYASEGSQWHGYRLVSMTALPHDALVVNCSTSIYPVTVGRKLRQALGDQVLEYAELMWAAPERFPVPDFVAASIRDVALNHHRWRELQGMLADDTSRQVLNDLLRFRMSGDVSVMDGYSVRFNDQYFDLPLALGDNAVFVDAGGFDGDSSEEFCKRYPNYRRIYLFEPARESLDKARQRLSQQRDVEYLELGLSSRRETLCFNTDGGSANAISDDGNMRIAVDTLDATVTEPVTLIKMDLEGWELHALEGCREHILNDHPFLAISVYHDPAHFWQVPELVRAIRDDYQVYLRHYTEGWSETVMYFVPKRA